MNYFVSRTDQAIQVSFAVKQSNGSLRTGLVAGDFVATVVKSDDSSSSAFAVSENSQKSGIYSFTVPASFFNVPGVYKFVVEIDTFTGPSGAPNVRDILSGNIRAQQEDVDTLADGGDGDFSRTADSQHDLRGKLNTDLDVAISTRASQSSVDAIQNVTRVAITIPKIVIPDAGTAPHEITLNMFDTAGNPEDPDENVVNTPAGNAGDAIVATDRLTVVNAGFTAADLNRVVRISGATNGGNNKDVRIVNVVDGQNVDVVDLDGSDPAFIGEGSGFTISVIDQITVVVNTQAGGDVSSRLDSSVMAKIGTGRFKVTYTADAAHAIENLIMRFAYNENAISFVQDRSVTTQKALEDNFTAADRAVLNGVATDTTNIETDTQDIQSRLPATLNGGRMRSHVEAIDVAAAQTVRDQILADSTPFNGADVATIKSTTDDLKQGLIVRQATALAGSSPSAVLTTLNEANGFWDGATVVFVNAAGTVPRRVSEYLLASGELRLDTPLPFTPALNDPIIIVNRHTEGQGGAG